MAQAGKLRMAFQELRLSRFHAVIFDMDGLLLDTERLALESFNHVCTLLGLGDRFDLFARCIGANAAAGEQVLRAGLPATVDYVEFIRQWDLVHSAANANRAPPLKSGAIELLEVLAGTAVPCAVATSTGSERAFTKLGHAGILQYFAAITTGDEVEHSKPFPDIYLRAAAKLAAPPGQCLALEDSELGVRAALAAGMTVIQVPDLLVPSPEFRALGHAVIDDLHAVRELLLSG